MPAAGQRQAGAEHQRGEHEHGAARDDDHHRRGRHLAHEWVGAASPARQADQNQRDLRDGDQPHPAQREPVGEPIGDLLAPAPEDGHHEKAQADGHQAHEGHVGLGLAAEHVEEGGAAEHAGHEPAGAAREDLAAHRVHQHQREHGHQAHADADGELVVAEDGQPHGHQPHQKDGLGEEVAALLVAAGVLPVGAPPGADPVVALGDLAADLPVVGLPGVPEPEAAQEGQVDQAGQQRHHRAVSPDAGGRRAHPGQLRQARGPAQLVPERGVGGGRLGVRLGLSGGGLVKRRHHGSGAQRGGGAARGRRAHAAEARAGRGGPRAPHLMRSR